MAAELRRAALVLLALTVLTGVVYPLVVTGVAHVLFPVQARGSVVEQDGRAVGSSLIGQPFEDPRYFWSRVSATTPFAYNVASSSGSNLGPTNPAWFEAGKARVDALRAADPGNTAPIPVDLVTASGSGLDPEISPSAAEYQVPRIARARGIGADAVRHLVSDATRGRTFGLLGEARVNVLELNLALDRASGRPRIEPEAPSPQHTGN